MNKQIFDVSKRPNLKLNRVYFERAILIMESRQDIIKIQRLINTKKEGLNCSVVIGRIAEFPVEIYLSTKSPVIQN